MIHLILRHSCLLLCFTTFQIHARILPTGVGKTYPTIKAAAMAAQPGDTILCYDATLSGGMYIENLQGTSQNWIWIIAANAGTTTITGGSNSIQFTDARYVGIEGFVISGQTGNGMNIDDGGTYSSPSHHVRIQDCIFENINATGNNDLLKLSGLDSFWISRCMFRNGAAGGSGIDMVGCHFGTIEDCEFSQLGSNSIQAKGGTADLLITRNIFTNGGARALNLGGSTGLTFFRPIDAKYEAARIRVIANVISGSEAPIAFVGCTQVEVSNNTLLFPGKWIMRILQETVDPTRFVPCGNNRFFNNIALIDQRVATEVNIGPNTAPETFSFEYNMWYKISQPSWTGPQLPGIKLNNWVENPRLVVDSLYVLEAGSPAESRGLGYGTLFITDISGKPFLNHPSLGAWEKRSATGANEIIDNHPAVVVYPNPVENNEINISGLPKGTINYNVVHNLGSIIMSGSLQGEDARINVEDLVDGIYFIVLTNDDLKVIRKIILWTQ